jgi:hypothetical protein
MNMRAATPDDLERALELLRLDEENLTGRPSCIGPSDLRQWLGDATLGEDTWLREDDGKLVAFYESVGMEVELEQTFFERALA